ncbi:MAG TPA: helix-turn-helix transcriptional regulator [Candidatus Binatia bacterium]|nr:helix-turn-helix transcriptional regulator [Candidatus Binatia bacterium]
MASAKLRRSSGDVFRDVGFSAHEASSLRIRADLMIKLSSIIERRGLTQAAAAALMGVTQPRISDLVRGKIELFSIDMLVEMLFRAGATVHFTVRTSKRAA